jgi:bacillopeptidase F
LKSAGIAVVFAAGNDGPAAATSNSPANNPGVLSVGAVDRDLAVGRQTSRGPSACDGAIFPALSAPGVNIRTTDLSHGGQPSFAMVSGSSLAAPHAAGVLAILAAAFPSASVAQLEAALLKGARDIGPPGPDNVFGHGLVDALASYKALEQSLTIGAASGPAPGPELVSARSGVARVGETQAPAASVVGRP